MASTLHIGLAQFDISWENPGANMSALDHLLPRSINTDLILLPEMWSTGFTMNTAQASEAPDGQAFQWMKEKAAALSSNLAGSISVTEKGTFYNRFFCLRPDGSSVKYDKKHLFSYGAEDHHYTPGNKHLVFQIGAWKIQPVVCYDLRFPVWCRNTVDYDVLVVVANWPEARIHHWDALLKARAIENQSFVVGVNRIGSDGHQIKYNGHSAVYDMNGEKILDMGNREGFGEIKIDKKDLDEFRQKYRFLQDRDSFIL